MNSIQAAIDVLNAAQAASVRQDDKVNAVRKRIADIERALQAARAVLATPPSGEAFSHGKRWTDRHRAAESEANLLASLKRQATWELERLKDERSILTLELHTQRRVLRGKVLDLMAHLDSNTVGEFQTAAVRADMRYSLAAVSHYPEDAGATLANLAVRYRTSD